MKPSLDTKDRKIIALLDQNSRISNAQIARKVKLSKPSVENRISKLEDNIIKHYYTIVDFNKLGYSQYKIYFKFQDVDPQKEKNIVRHWEKRKGVIWVALLRGRWDLAVSILSRSNFGFGQEIRAFLDIYAHNIMRKDVLLTEYSPLYSREYLSDNKPEEFLYGVPETIFRMDEVEKKILRGISVDARINIVDLSRKLDLTRDIVNYRLKKLKGLIHGYSCELNLEAIGINHYKIILRTKNLDNESEKRLKEYVSQHRQARQFLKLIGSWDIEIEFETEGENRLYQILAEIRSRFSDIIRDYDIIRIVKTYKLDFFPF